MLVAFLNALLKRLDAFLEWVEQLAQVLLAGLGETLFTLIEDLGSHLGELGTQGIARLLQVFETLLVAFLLFPQLCLQACGLGLQATLLGFPIGPLELPGVGGITGVVAIDLQ